MWIAAADPHLLSATCFSATRADMNAKHCCPVRCIPARSSNVARPTGNRDHAGGAVATDVRP